MRKKAYAFFLVLVILLAAACRSIASVSGGDEYVAAALGQSLYRLDVAKTRGTIYDCRMTPLACGTEKKIAAVAPTIETIGALEKATGGRYRARLAAALEDGKPFLLELDEDLPCVDMFHVPQRYFTWQPAPHVIGCLDSLGRGASGIELAMNDVLEEHSGEASVLYQVDALGRVMAGGVKQVTDTLSQSRGGVALTLDSAIQTIVQREGAALGRGAVVVTEVPNCEIRALASFPSFSPLDLAAAAADENSPLINRAFCAYAPGSVFKLIPAAVELESGSGAEKYLCAGAVNAGGMLFHCYDGKAHGEVDLQGALTRSCNCYFISRVRALGSQSVLNMAYNLGLGEEQEFGRGLFSAAGTLPRAADLENPRALANFSFGQGEITVTPLQMCGVVNAIASGGTYSTPKLILGLVNEDRELAPVQPVTDRSFRAMSAAAAGGLQSAMEAAVREGTARPGAPENCVAGVKTGTAQTGAYQDGEELLHFWYCGYIRDESGPRYCVTVLCEGVPDDGGVTARVFRRVAEEIAALSPPEE